MPSTRAGTFRPVWTKSIVSESRQRRRANPVAQRHALFAGACGSASTGLRTEPLETKRYAGKAQRSACYQGNPQCASPSIGVTGSIAIQKKLPQKYTAAET